MSCPDWHMDPDRSRQELFESYKTVRRLLLDIQGDRDAGEAKPYAPYRNITARVPADWQERYRAWRYPEMKETKPS